ncbi:sensor histidine kinase [Ensifer sp.]|uniref:sensor histidine kinase n=1 Tax=Ensifer sp. TaxID=1872086 RepID=UPI002E136741|nr:ATP-binding protein [Ensifer sp.]
MGASLRRAGLALIAAVAFGGSAFAERILILYENESTQPATMEIAQGISRRLVEDKRHVELYSEHLDLVRFGSDGDRQRLIEYVRAKYAGKPLDALLTVGPSALRFALAERDRFAPGVPIVFGAVRGFPEDVPMPPNVTGVFSRFDVKGTLELARRLQPDAKRATILTGSAPFDRSWEETAHALLGRQYAGFDIDYLTGLSLDGFKAKAAALPPDSVLLILTVFADAGGVSYIPRDAASGIAATSGAPVYSVYSSYFDGTVLAGHVSTFGAIGEDMAARALRIFDGKGIVPPETLKEVALIDWRQVVSRGIARDAIPADATILNYQPTAWEQFRLPIMLGLSVIAAQALSIAVIVFENRRNRRLEDTVSTQRLELAHVSRRAQVSQLSGTLAHELTQPLTSILANAEAGRKIASADDADLREIGEIFDDIVADNRRAAEVIAQLRSMMRKGEGSVETTDLNEAVRSTVALVGPEMLARRTQVSVSPSPEPLPVRANMVQLQQVVLNLILNASDAMAELPPKQRKIEITTGLGDNGMRHVTVSDAGPGIAPDQMKDVFKPFVTTKENGLGLGLAICRSLLEARGGKLVFDGEVARGARAIVTLPPG